MQMSTDTARTPDETDSETATWRIDVLCCGVLHGVPEAALMYMNATANRVDLPILAWLLRSASECLLVDTGPTSVESARERFHPELEQTDGRTLIEQMSRRDVAPSGITAVINTHLHWDHCGGNFHFMAPTYVQREELRFASAPLPTQLAPYEAAELGMEPPWFSSASRFRLVEGTIRLRPGITLLPLPGHTPGSQGVLVETADGRFCITGDLLDSFENVHGQMPGWPDHIRGVPAGIHTDVEAWYRSLRLLEAMKVKLLPAHDWEVLKVGSFG